MVNLYIVIGVSAIAAPVLFGVATSSRRRAIEPCKILDELKKLPCAIDDEDESAMWSLERDTAFWTQIGGMRGLLRLRKKSAYLRDLVTGLNLAPSDMDEMEFISHRCYWIMALVAFQFVLLPLSTPHFLGRWAAGLYSEVRTRTLTLCRAYNRALYGDLKAIA